MKAKMRTIQCYDDAFRREVVSEYLKGGVSIRELNRRHGILRNSAITDWVRQLGYSNDNTLIKKAKFEIPLLKIPMAGPEKNNLELQKEISDLKRKLEEEKLRSEAYLRIIQKTEEELKTSIKKKPGTR